MKNQSSIDPNGTGKVRLASHAKSANPSGSYVLEILVKENVQIKIGSLGFITFVPGYYYYIGSALNGNLINRVKRHTKEPSAKKLHWHLDYLLANPHVHVNGMVLIPSSTREECALGDNIWELIKHRNLTTDNHQKISKFGSSDCICGSHLFFSQNPIFQ